MLVTTFVMPLAVKILSILGAEYFQIPRLQIFAPVPVVQYHVKARLLRLILVLKKKILLACMKKKPYYINGTLSILWL